MQTHPTPYMMDDHQLAQYIQTIRRAHQAGFSQEEHVCQAILCEAEKAEHAQLMVICYLHLFYCAIMLEEHAHLTTYQMQALQISQDHQYQDLIACTHLLSGLQASFQCHEETALDCYLQAFSYALDHTVKALVYFQIGNLFQEHQAHEDAMTYYQQATLLLPQDEQELTFVLACRMAISTSHYSAAIQPYKTIIDTYAHVYPFSASITKLIVEWQLGKKTEASNRLQTLDLHCEEPIGRRQLFLVYHTVFIIALASSLKEQAHQLLMKLGEQQGYHKRDVIIVQSCFIKYSEQFDTPYDTTTLYKDYFHFMGDPMDCHTFRIQTIRNQLQLEKIKQQNQLLRQKASLDEVTQLKNRACCQMELQELLQREDVYQIGIAMCDIDNFKEFNDQYGHLYGDKIIRKMAHILEKFKSDHINPYRFGGDEFLCLFINLHRQDIIDYLVTIFNELNKQEAKLHISAGFAFTKNEGSLSIDQLIAQADAALYQAKNEGKNQFMEYGSR